MTATTKTMKTDEVKTLEKEIAKLSKMAETRARLAVIFRELWAAKLAYAAEWSAWDARRDAAYHAAADTGEDVDESVEDDEPEETWNQGQRYAAMERACLDHLFDGISDDLDDAEQERRVMMTIDAWERVPDLLIAERRVRMAFIANFPADVAQQVGIMIDDIEI